MCVFFLFNLIKAGRNMKDQHLNQFSRPNFESESAHVKNGVIICEIICQVVKGVQ